MQDNANTSKKRNGCCPTNFSSFNGSLSMQGKFPDLTVQLIIIGQQDGYELEGDNTTTCMYGNWTGTTPNCVETYCPFPGYLPHGKILLVGNMGLYDYRPYVKKITNDRQILFDCDKDCLEFQIPTNIKIISMVLLY